MIGQTISHYRITAKLGSGGMAMVYQARDLSLDRNVALKFLHTEQFSDELARKRLVQEAKAVSALDHPNIATVYEIGEADELLFISMGYYEGQTLRELLAQGVLDLSTCYDIAIQTCKGLAEAHRVGIIHRDIKPANIMITAQQQVKILDFGIAKVTALPALTLDDSIIGTSAFMSPEQIQGRALDGRSDIFSFGTVLYEMACGRKPFQGDYSAAITYAIVNEEPPQPCQVRPELPAKVERIILKALQKDPDKRYQSASDLEADLIGCMQTDAPARTRSTRGSPTSKRRLGIWVGAAALLLTLLYFVLLPSHNAAPVSLMVAPFAFQGLDDEWSWLSDALTELLNKNLARDPGIKALDAEKRTQLMGKLGFQQQKMTNERRLVLAKKAHMANIVHGLLTKQGDLLSVRAQLFNAETGDVIASLTPAQALVSKPGELANNLYEQLVALLRPGTDAHAPAARQEVSSLDAFRFYLEGRDAVFDRRHDEGIRKLGKAIALDSSFIEPYYWLAYAFVETGDRKSARSVLRLGQPYLSFLSEQAKLEYLSQEAMVDGRWKDYILYLDHLLRISPSEPAYHFRYGFTLARKFRQIEPGITAMLRSVALDSTYSIAYNELAFAYLEKGDSKTALSMVRTYAQLNPTRLNPLDSQAEIQLYTGAYQNTIATCERILAIQPAFWSTHVLLIRAYLATGRLAQADAALLSFTALTKSGQHAAAAQTLRAELMMLQDHYPEALHAIDRALTADADNLRAHWVAGNIYLHMALNARVDEEVAAMTRILDARGDLFNRWLLYHLEGKKSLASGELDRAENWFIQAVQLAPRDRSFFLLELANVQAQLADWRAAEQNFRAALEFNANSGDAAFGLAQLCETTGRPAEARTYYRQAMGIWKNHEARVPQHDIARQRAAELSSQHSQNR